MLFSRVVLILISPVLSGVVVQADSPRKIPAPSFGDQLLAKGQIKEIFKQEYDQTSPASKLSLADKLIRLALETTDDSIRRYVLLREARDLAIQAAEPGTALRAIDLLVKDYLVDGLVLREETLSATSKDVRSTEAARSATERTLSLVDEAIATDRYDIAARLVSAGTKLAQKTKDSAVLSRARSLEAHAGTLQREHSRLEVSRKALGENPSDPAANAALGNFYCFLKGDWKRGLPHLSKSNDPRLKALAEMELSEPKAVAGQTDLATEWSMLAEKQTATLKQAMEGRALLWYETAYPKLSGLEKAEVGRKISALLFGTAQVWETSAENVGVPIGGEPQNASQDFTIEFWFSTAAYSGILLTKRHVESDASLTLSLGGGCPSVMGDAAFYKVTGTATIAANDGRWHHIAVVKSNTRVQLFLDGKAAAGIVTRPNFPSKSPWVLGYHGSWGEGALDARFCKIRLSKTARYSGAFLPQRDYGADKETVLFK